MRLLLVVAAALLDRQGRVLLSERPSGRDLSGTWEFPGGKPEPGESPEIALARELREELDLIVAPQDLEPLTFASHAYDRAHLLMPLFTCRRWVGDPAPQEGQRIAWVAADELESWRMPPADRPLLAPLRKFLAG